MLLLQGLKVYGHRIGSAEAWLSVLMRAPLELAAIPPMDIALTSARQLGLGGAHDDEPITSTCQHAVIEFIPVKQLRYLRKR